MLRGDVGFWTPPRSSVESAGSIGVALTLQAPKTNIFCLFLTSLVRLYVSASVPLYNVQHVPVRLRSQVYARTLTLTVQPNRAHQTVVGRRRPRPPSSSRRRGPGAPPSSGRAGTDGGAQRLRASGASQARRSGAGTRAGGAFMRWPPPTSRQCFFCSTTTRWRALRHIFCKGLWPGSCATTPQLPGRRPLCIVFYVG